MSKIKNIPNSGDEIADVCRAQSEHRGMWVGLIFDELKKTGADAEGIYRRAIRRRGVIQGKNLREKCADPKNYNEFKKAFESGGLTNRIFNAKNASSDEDNFKIEFQFCAMVSAWQKLGFDDETCALLCDMALEMDIGVADGMGDDMKFNMAETIGKGNSCCRLHYYK